MTAPVSSFEPISFDRIDLTHSMVLLELLVNSTTGGGVQNEEGRGRGERNGKKSTGEKHSTEEGRGAYQEYH